MGHGCPSVTGGPVPYAEGRGSAGRMAIPELAFCSGPAISSSNGWQQFLQMERYRAESSRMVHGKILSEQMASVRFTERVDRNGTIP